MSAPVRAALAGSDRGALCKGAPERVDCSGCCGDDEVNDDDGDVVEPGGLLLFDRCMSR